jgi:transcriptional regulator with XRE-family HTH domain
MNWEETQAARGDSEAVRRGYEKAQRLHETGDMIRALRPAKGMTQRELSHRAKVSVSTLSRLESGESMPNFESLDRLRAALRATVAWEIRPVPEV